MVKMIKLKKRKTSMKIYGLNKIWPRVKLVVEGMLSLITYVKKIF